LSAEDRRVLDAELCADVSNLEGWANYRRCQGDRGATGCAGDCGSGG
jgi:hypothetical protein